MQNAHGQDHHLVVDGRHTRVRETGRRGAPPVMVLHGIMGHAREWDSMIERLDAHVFAVDQRGHGMSDWATDYTVAAMADDIVDVIQQLELPSPPAIVGHSMGGMVGLHLAAHFPDLVRGLTVIDITPDSITPEAADGLEAFLEMLADSSYSSVPEAMTPWLGGNVLAQPDLLRHYTEHGTRRREDGRLVWRFDGHGLTHFPRSVSPAALWDAVDAVAMPALVVHGEHSPFVSQGAAEELARRLRTNRRVVIPRGGHDLGVEQPGPVGDAVASFLAEVTAQAVSR